MRGPPDRSLLRHQTLLRLLDALITYVECMLFELRPQWPSRFITKNKTIQTTLTKWKYVLSRVAEINY